MRALVRRLVHLGVDHTVSARDAKYMIVTNAVLVVTALQGLALIPLTIAVGFHLVPWAVAFTAVGCGGALALSATGRHLAARLALVAVATIAIVTGALLAGPASRTELYFFIAVAGAWFVFPSARGATVATLVYVVGYVAVLVLYQHVTPPDPVPASVRSTYHLLLAGMVMLGLLGFAAWSHWQSSLTDRQLEDLLHNILPRPVALRLQHGQHAIADRLDDVTVLFADLANFTPRAEKVSPAELVGVLDEVFSRFDALCDRYGLEKIKTIGDAYMVVGGAPEPRPDHAEAVVALALEMFAAIEVPITTPGAAPILPLELRIGIHSGPVIAGVIGRRKFAYDLWGDTVNTASRMESHGVPGRIQVSDAVRDRLADRFRFEARGVIPIKGKGELSTWFVLGRQAE